MKKILILLIIKFICFKSIICRKYLRFSYYKFVCKSITCRFRMKYMDVGRNLVYNEDRRIGFNGTMRDSNVNVGPGT